MTPHTLLLSHAVIETRHPPNSQAHKSGIIHHRLRSHRPSPQTNNSYLRSATQRQQAMPPKPPTNWRLWTKVLVGGAAISVGGPLLTMRLTPTEEELRAKYNPDLLKKSIETREEREQEFDDFVTRLKEYSKSDKPIWIVVKEEEERRKKAVLDAAKVQQKEADARREEMRREAGLAAK